MDGEAFFQFGDVALVVVKILVDEEDDSSLHALRFACKTTKKLVGRALEKTRRCPGCNKWRWKEDVFCRAFELYAETANASTLRMYGIDETCLSSIVPAFGPLCQRKRIVIATENMYHAMAVHIARLVLCTLFRIPKMRIGLLGYNTQDLIGLGGIMPARVDQVPDESCTFDTGASMTWSVQKLQEGGWDAVVVGPRAFSTTFYDLTVQGLSEVCQSESTAVFAVCAVGRNCSVPNIPESIEKKVLWSKQDTDLSVGEIKLDDFCDMLLRNARRVRGRTMFDELPRLV
jgi:hypothetical protein